ncbi:hypothetical protein ABFA07_017494 [Porites harrisoni]
MASLSEAEEALRSTKQKSNFLRLTRLLIRGGAVLFREIFDSIHSPANLPTTLSDPSVERQLRRARLTIPERKCLYPSPGVYGKSSDFDISLIFKLLRTICNLTPPPTGWDSLPNDFDHSLEADLARIKYYRNEVYGHSNNLEIPDEQFLDLWGKISEALLRIAGHLCPEKQNNWKDAMEKFLRDPLTPEEERYAEELELWYQKDIDNTKVLRELVQEVKELREDTRDQQDAMLRLGMVIESFVQYGVVVAPGEMHRNQQEIPAEVDLWNVIVAFEHPFRLLFGYLGNTLSAFIEDIELGSLSITVKCSSLQILEGLWEDYVSGHLNQVVQETLVTNEVLENLGLDDVKLKVFISEEEYRHGKRILTAENSESSEQSPALEEKNSQVKDRPGLGSVPPTEPITTDQEKQRAPERRASITCPQVILVSGKEITREMVVFDPDVGKLICSKILKDISDRAIVVDMNKAGIGGFFFVSVV